MIKFVYSQTTNALEVYKENALYSTDDIIFVKDKPHIVTHGTVYWGDVSLGGIPSLVKTEFTEENITADNISLRPSSAYNPDSSFSEITNTMNLGLVTQQLDYRTLRDASNIADLSSNALIKNSTSNYELTKFKNNLVYLSGVSDSSDDGHILFMGHDADGSTSVFDIDLNHVHTVKIGNRYISTDADNTITDYQINVLGWAADASKLGTYDASSYGRTIQIDGFDPIPAVQGTFRISAETLRGYQGQQGIQGQQGTQGLQGLQGLQGKGGIQGEQGAQGLQGLQGLQGKIGSQGEQGLQGLQGLQGRWGEQGIQGQAIYETSKSLHLQGTDGKYIDFNGSKDVSVSGIYNAKNATNADVADHAVQAAKLTTDAGDVSVPIYFKNGVPVAMDGSIGGSQHPVYLNNGKITPGDALGTMAYENASSYRKTADDKTLYVQGVDGTFKTFNGSADVSILGVKKADSANSATQASYASKLNTNAGDSSTPVYFNNGVPVALSGNIGDASLPVYIKDGHIQAGTRLKTMAYEDASNYVKKTDSTVTSKKLYVQGVDGTFKSFNGSADVSILGVKSADTANSATQAAYASKLNTNAGDSSTPVYFNNGVPVAFSGNIGDASLPVYIKDGHIQAGTRLNTMAYQDASDYALKEDLPKVARLVDISSDVNEDGILNLVQVDSDGSTNTISVDFRHSHYIKLGSTFINTDTENDVSVYDINILGKAGDSSKLGGKDASAYGHTLNIGGDVITAVQGVFNVSGEQFRGYQGQQGLQGEQGTQGLQGLQGIQGKGGIQGEQGLQGLQGLQGRWGEQGTQGTQGLQGLQGHLGHQGVQGQAVYETSKSLHIQGVDGKYINFNGSADTSVLGVFNAKNASFADHADDASKLTVNGGDSSTPIYFENGVPTAFSGNIGDASLPVYIKNGHITVGSRLKTMAYEDASDYVKKSDSTATTKKLYVQGVDGTFKTFNGSADVSILGVKSADTANSATQAAYATRLNSSAGDASHPIYFKDGQPVAMDASIGGAQQPIYLNNGQITAGSALGNMAYEAKSNYPTSLQMAETLQKTQRLTNLEKGDNNGEVKFTQIDSDGSTNTITMNFSHEHFVQIGNSLIATDSSNDVSLFNINISGHANDSSMLGGTPASNYAMALTVEGYETVYAQRGIISVKADLLRGLQGSQGIQGHRGYQGLQGSAVYQTGQALSIQGLNGHYDVFNGSTAKSIQGVYKSQYSEYSVTADRLSTQAVGDNSTFVYFDVNGMAKASNQSVGASDTPVYLNAGHIQAGAKLGSMAYENASEYEKSASKKTLYVQGVNGVFTSFNGSADVSILGVKSADTANSATQAGKLTTDAGDASRFIYFNNGVPVASDLSLGSETKPIFIGNGRFMEGDALGTMAYETASEYVKGSAVKKLYVQGVNGQFTSYDGTADVSILGVKNADKANSATNATHAADASKLTTGNTGDGSTLVYFSGGVPTKSTSTVGNATNPVYLNNGVLTPCSEDLVTFADTGANDKFIYFNDGVPVASDLSLGSKTSFLYLENGQFKTQALPTPSAGSNTEFIYFNNGVPTKSDVSLGGLQKPIYLDDGMFKEGTALGDMAYESKSNYINSTQAVDLANKVNRITTVERDPSSFGIIKFTQVDSSGNENTISADFNHNHFLNIGNTILTTDQLSSVDTLDISITGTARDTSLFRGLTPSQFVRNVYFNGSNLTPNNGSVSINLGQFSIQDASGIWQGYNGNAPVAIQGVYRASNAEALGGYPSDHYATHSEIAGMDASIKSINYLKNILDHPSNANTITFVGHDMNTGEDSSIDIDFTHSHYFHIGTTAITSDQASNTISSLDIDITGTSRDSSKLGGLDPSNYVTAVNVIGGASYRPNRGVITLYPTDFETANTVKTISVGANTYYVNNQDVSIPSMVNGATANHDGILHLTTLGGGNLDINFNHSHNLYIGDRIFTTNDQDSQNVWKDVGYLSLRAVSGASSAALTLSGMSTWLFHDTTLDYGIYYDRLLHRVEFHGPNNRMSYIDMTNGTFNGWNSMNTGSGGTSTDASYLEGYSLSQIFEEFGQDPTDAKKTYLKIGKTVKTLQIPYAINAGAAESAETAASATSADVATRAQYIGNNDSVRYDASTLLGDVSYNGTNNTLSIKVGNTTKTATISTSPSADYPTGFAARNSQVNNSSLGTWVTGWKDGNPYINFFKSGNALNVQASGAFYNGSYRTVDTNTIGSLTAGYAKLSTDGGAANQPIYIKNGVPATLGSKGDASKGVYIDSSGIIKEMTYRLGKSVPSDAVFTDENATYSGHYTPASNSTSVITGKTANTSNPTSSITLLHSVFKDGKGHLLDASYYQFTFGSLAYEDSVDKLGGYDTSVFGRKIKIGDVSFTAVNGMFEIPLSVISAQNGSQGAQGKVGPQGSVGAQGSTGSQGKVGSQGAQGLLGVQGSRGSQGPAGSDGNPGSQGAQGRLGNQGSQGARGGSGVGYGEDGEQGAQGTAGSNGTNGTNGSQGAQGARGSAGYGYDGDQGAQGLQGKVGATGTGSQGAQGKVGSQGSVGAQGPAGSSSGTADYLNGDSSSTNSDYYVAFFDGNRRKYDSYFTYNPYASRLSVYSLDVASGSCEIDDHGWVTCYGVTSNGSISSTSEIKADTHLKAEKSGSSYLFYTASDGAYFASDRRLKENIRPISDDLVSKVFREDTDLLHTFTWKETKHEAAGFIAQELLEVLPNAVDYDKETDKYSVNYNVALSEVLGAAVKKIKTQQEEIHDLRKEIDDLRKLIMEKLS